MKYRHDFGCTYLRHCFVRVTITRLPTQRLCGPLEIDENMQRIRVQESTLLALMPPMMDWVDLRFVRTRAFPVEGLNNIEVLVYSLRSGSLAGFFISSSAFLTTAGRGKSWFQTVSVCGFICASTRRLRSFGVSKVR